MRNAGKWRQRLMERLSRVEYDRTHEVVVSDGVRLGERCEPSVVDLPGQAEYNGTNAVFATSLQHAAVLLLVRLIPAATPELEARYAGYTAALSGGGTQAVREWCK